MAPTKTKKKTSKRKTAPRKTIRKTARKTTAPKTARKTTARKTARKTTARKTARKKTASKKTASKKTARKTTARKTARKKTARKKTASKKTVRKTARRTTSRRAGGRKTKARAKSKARTLKPGARLADRALETTTQRFALVSRLIARAFAQRLAPKGIGYGQFPVLLCLWDEDGITQKTLSERIRIEAPTMVRTLDRMERDNLVSRVRSITDRRQIHVRLTEKGRRLKKVLARLSSDVDKTALAGLGRAGHQTLRVLLGRLIQNLEQDIALDV